MTPLPLPVARLVYLGPRLRRYIALGAIRQALAENLFGAEPTIMREGADAYGPIAMPIAGPGVRCSR